MTSAFRWPVTDKMIADLHAYMKKNCRGKSNAKRASTISARLRYPKHTNSAPLRAVIREAVLRGIPIIGTQHGFFLAETRHEIDKAVESLRYRIDQTVERADALEVASL